MEYLTQQNRRCEGERIADDRFITAKDRHVIIIGGGDTGADCLGTSHRQGAASVHQLELLSRPPDDRAGDNPWPLWPNIFRTSPAHEEGGERLYTIATSRFSGNQQGRVTTLHASEVQQVDTNGRVAFKPVPGTEVDSGRTRAARDGIPRPGTRRHARPARCEDDRPRQCLA